MPMLPRSPVYIVTARFHGWLYDESTVNIEPSEQLELLMPLGASFLPVRFRRCSTGEICLASEQAFLAAVVAKP